MGVFPSRAFFLQLLQATQQEDASASEALSTNASHQELCLRVLQLQMHLCAVLAEPGRRKQRKKGKKQEEEGEEGGARRKEEKKQGREKKKEEVEGERGRRTERRRRKRNKE